MQFRWQAADNKEWHRKFAVLPRQVGVAVDASAVMVWWEHYERRLVSTGSYSATWEFRPVGGSALVAPYKETEWMTDL